MPAGLVVSAAASGSGKTTVTLGLLRALRRRGLAVQPFKCGPDYIDPVFHGVASGRPCLNLDGWAMTAGLIAHLARAAHDADLIVAEGAMGLFDGAALRGAAGNGASADIAALMGWPVVLVLDCGGQAQTAAAVALGMTQFRADVRIAGVILNKVASPRHEALVRAGFAGLSLPILGALPRQASVALPERHLGLVQAGELGDLDAILDAAAGLMDAHVDLDRLIAAAGQVALPAADSAQMPHPPGQRIAIARDQAFSFVYPHLVAGWQQAGAEVLPFSPLADEGPDPSADTCWLPGGYPELHAGRLSAAHHFRRELAAFAMTRPVHGECGGYMAMGEALVDADGIAHPMAGLLGLVTSFAARKLHLGYRRARLMGAVLGYPAGSTLVGHEFHYASIAETRDDPLAHVTDAGGAVVAETGSRRGMASGSFFHLIAAGAQSA
ncbi:MAG: cobyrinate a,c-diamide synthase [Hyphomicrobiaceae bacterium]|nr:cobyrinate a,c-diamide synthase [Hyphomicrobiaceae bacterium]